MLGSFVRDYNIPPFKILFTLSIPVFLSIMQNETTQKNSSVVIPAVTDPGAISKPSLLIKANDKEAAHKSVKISAKILPR